MRNRDCGKGVYRGATTPKNAFSELVPSVFIPSHLVVQLDFTEGGGGGADSFCFLNVGGAAPYERICNSPLFTNLIVSGLP